MTPTNAEEARSAAFEDRACNVKGCPERHALLYGVCIDGVPLDAAAALCSKHGAAFLLRAGQLLGELLKGNFGGST